MDGGVVHSYGVGGWSGMDLEGQELLRVHVVERAQVWQFEEQFSEDGDLVGVVLGDQAAQSSNQSFLKGLNRVDVLKTGAIYGKHNSFNTVSQGVISDTKLRSHNGMAQQEAVNTCRHQHYSREEAHLLLTEVQCLQLLGEVKH